MQEDFPDSGNAQAHEGKVLRIFSPVSAPLKEEFFTMRRISRIRECTHFLSEWGNHVKYKFVLPVYKRSTKRYAIKNDNDEIIGEIQRFYKNKMQFLLDFCFDPFFLNSKVFDEKLNFKVEARQRLTFFRDVWDICENDKTYPLKETSKIRTNPRFLLSYGGKNLLVYKNYLDKFIRIKDVDSGKILSEWEFKKSLPPREASIRIFDPAIDIYLAICLYIILANKY